MTAPATILRRADKGERVADIARVEGVKPGHVYQLLREQRPDRERSPRTLTSDIPGKVRALVKLKFKPARIAVMLKVSRAYVYRILAEN